MEKAVRTRAAAKGWLSRASAEIESLLSEAEADPVSVTESALVDCMEQFSKRLSAYDEAQGAVELVIDMKDLDSDISISADYRITIRKAYIRAGELLAKLTSKVEASGGGGLNQSRSSGVGDTHQARLPKLELPKFSGDHTQWQPFWDKFQAVVDKSDLALVTKFTYLQSLLKGEAAAAISGLSLTESNYSIACDILIKRFGRKERIVFGHIQELLNLDSTGKTVESLWALYDKLQSHIRSLESLGVTGDAYGVILTPMVLHRLPESVRLEWARVGEGKESDLEGLLQFLFMEIQRRERSRTFQTQVRDREERKPRATAAALHSASEKKDGPSCGVCSGKHRTERCFSLKDLEPVARKNKCFEKGLCFICFEKHLLKHCGNKTKCVVCGGLHHRLLCTNDRGVLGSSRGTGVGNKEQDQPKRENGNVDPSSNTQVFSARVRKGNDVKQTVLQMVRVKVKGQKQEVQANMLFDSGSDRSYISSSLVKKIVPTPAGQEFVSVALFGDAKPNEPKLRKRHKIQVLCQDESFETLTVMETPVICSPVYRPRVPVEILNKMRLENLDWENSLVGDSDSQTEVDILVGLDYYWGLVKPGNTLLSDHLSIQETKFGYVLSGSWDINKGNAQQRVNHQFLCMGDVGEAVCHKLWDLETLGITENIDSDKNKNDDNVLRDFNQTVEFVDGRYVVHLPWKEGQRDKLISNEEIAKKRNNNLLKKFDRDPALEMEYNKVLSDMENAGIIHEVPNEEDSTNPIFYLPHRPVIREASATTKIRPVFDASCKAFNGYSLNDCVESGPNLIPNLVEVLLRFRRWKYGLTADISKAFLQIRVCEQDQDVHRFFWDVRNQVRVMRFDRVVFGDASSPFLLNATIKYHLNQYHDSVVVSELRENLYVDDWLTGSDSQDEIVKMASEAENILGQGGFPLAKWGSNSTLVGDRVVRDLSKDCSETHPRLKILGISWSTSEDCFLFETFPVGEGIQFTKRLVLSLIARIFDPLGFLNPFIIGIKIMFQEIWRLGLSWDEPLPLNMQKQMSIWVEGLQEIKGWRIPRCFSLDAWDGRNRLTLIGYSDASEKAYGGNIYLRMANAEMCKVSLVISKTRVAPIKKMTLPRLELMGALLVARLLVFVRNSLRLPMDTSYCCFTDSTIVLGWIKADPSKWKQFVGNRVSEIQNLTNPSNWAHCAGRNNPADLLTRGITATELVESHFWLQGCSTDPELEVYDLSTADLLSSDEENLTETSAHDTVLSTVTKEAAPLVKYENFSQFSKIVSVIGWVKRFIFNLQNSNRRLMGSLTQLELKESETLLLMSIQREAYFEDINALQKNKPLAKKSGLYKLGPFLGEDGLLRVKGRLQMSNVLSYAEKHPILLPNCHVTFLLIQFEHRLMKHAGVTTLLSCLRDRYWIISLRRLAKRVCSQCVACQRHDSRACDQPMAPLPKDRIHSTPPFSVVGVDHAGPVYCCDTGSRKHYILLITCAVVRAVHLELVPSLSLEDFILHFRRFCARRGLPSVIYSDNARTFIGADVLLQRSFGPNAPTWKFSAPLAPWWGGWWERLVRSTKSALRKSLGRQSVTKSQLETILVEVEGCINSRPLTYVEEDCVPLTPSHFLIGRSAPFVPLSYGVDPSRSLPQSSLDLVMKSREISEALEHFWSVWNRQYIRNLPPLGNRRSNMDLAIGSIVLIRDEGKPRLNWPLGKIVSLHQGKDGFVRAATVKTANGEVIRAIQRLHRLEISQSQPRDPKKSETVSCKTKQEGVSDDLSLSQTSDNLGGKGIRRSSRGRVLKQKQILDL